MAIVISGAARYANSLTGTGKTTTAQRFVRGFDMALFFAGVFVGAHVGLVIAALLIGVGQ
jgi:formate-dependent nitrite reductase membrane component NrfD